MLNNKHTLIIRQHLYFKIKTIMRLPILSHWYVYVL